MLGDSEIESLDKQLDSIVENSRRYHEDLNSLFEKFQDLLESYNQLKSDYEEEKEAREKYKKLAKGLVRGFRFFRGPSLLSARLCLLFSSPSLMFPLFVSGPKSVRLSPYRWRWLYCQYLSVSNLLIHNALWLNCTSSKSVLSEVVRTAESMRRVC